MDFGKIQSAILSFVQERNWKQFHNPKDLASSISIEAAELEELFLWKSSKESYKIGEDDPRVKEEFADIFMCLIMFADECHIDIEKAIMDKLEKTKKKYPVEKAKGNNKKYTEL